MSEKVAGGKLSFGCSKSYVINSIITLAIMIGFKYVVPASDPLTPTGVEVLGVFIGMLYGWLVVGDLIWPSVAGLVFLGLSGYEKVTESFAAGFGNNTVLLMLFFFVFTNIINSVGLIDYVARWIATRKIAFGKPWVLSLLLLLATIVTFFMVSATAACLVMIPLIKSISKIYGFKAGDKWPMLMMGGLVFVGSTSYVFLPYKSLPVVVFGTYTATTGLSIAYGPYMLVIFISTAVSLAMFLLSCKFIFKPDVSPIKNCKANSIEKLEKLNPQQRFVVWYFIVVLALMMIPNLLPTSIPFVAVLNSIGNVGILVLAVGFYLACQLKDGASVADLFAHNISWGIIFLLAAAMAISPAFVSDKTGVSAWLTAVISPLVAGKSAFMFIVIVCIITCVLTNVANNQAVCAILTPIILSVGSAFGANLVTLVVCMMCTANIGMVTPPASATGALLHGDKEWVPGKSAYTYGIYYSLINLVNVLFVVYPLGCLLL